MFATIKKYKITKLPAMVVSALMGISLLFSSAVFSSDYFIYPLKLEKVIKKNQQAITGSIQASNIGTDNQGIVLKVTPYLWDMQPNGSLGIISEPSEADAFILQNFKVNPMQFSLKPKEDRLVRFAFKPPSSTTPKEYHVQLVFEQIGDVKPDTILNLEPAANIKTQVKVLTNFATNIYIYQGDVRTDTKLTQFDCEYIPNIKKLNLTMNLHNDGSLHSRLKGLLLVSQTDNVNKVGDIKTFPIINSAIIAVLPSHDRLVQQRFNFTDLSPGQYNIELHLSDERGFDPPIEKSCSVLVPKT